MAKTKLEPFQKNNYIITYKNLQSAKLQSDSIVQYFYSIWNNRLEFIMELVKIELWITIFQQSW